MIVYGCMTGTLQKEDIKYISIKQANQILNTKQHSNKVATWIWKCRIKEKEIKPFVKEKKFIKV